MRWPSLLSGTVLIECEGGYPERFLNAASAAGIPVWGAERREASLWCRARAADYRRLRPVSRHAGTRMRVRRKYGLPHLLHRRGLRPGMVAGAAVFLLILQLLSSRIWVLRITGNTTVPDSAVLEMLKTLGVCEGARFDHADLTDIRLTALQQLPDLTRLTLNQSGSILTVEVAERTESAPIAADSPANLVASCDGVILEVDTFTGQAMVKAGDAVRRGDLLISGVMDSKVGPQLKHAAGHVLARTTHTLTVSVPLKEVIMLPDKEVVRSHLTIFGLSIPLYTSVPLASDATVVRETHPVTANGVPLPIGLSTTRYRYDRAVTVTRTPEEAQRLAEGRLAAAEAQLRTVLTVEQRVPAVEVGKAGVTLRVIFHGTQELGEERLIG